MKRGKVLIIFLMLLLCVSFVSAGFLGDIFGRLFGGKDYLTGFAIGEGSSDEITLYEDTLYPQIQTRVKLDEIVNETSVNIDINGEIYTISINELKWVDSLGIAVTDINLNSKSKLIDPKVKLKVYTKSGEIVNPAVLRLEKGLDKKINFFNKPQKEDFLLELASLERLEDIWRIKLKQNGEIKYFGVGGINEFNLEVYRVRLSSLNRNPDVFIKPGSENRIVLEEKDFIWVLNKGFFIEELAEISTGDYMISTFDNGRVDNNYAINIGVPFYFVNRDFKLLEVIDETYDDQSLKLFKFKRTQSLESPSPSYSEEENVCEDVQDCHPLKEYCIDGSCKKLTDSQIETREIYTEIIKKINNINEKLGVLEDIDENERTAPIDGSRVINTKEEIGDVVRRGFPTGKVVDNSDFSKYKVSDLNVQNFDSKVLDLDIQDNMPEDSLPDSPEEYWEDALYQSGWYQFIAIPQINSQMQEIEETVCEWVEDIENLPYGYLILYQYDDENEIICPNQLLRVRTDDDDDDEEEVQSSSGYPTNTKVEEKGELETQREGFFERWFGGIGR